MHAISKTRRPPVFMFSMAALLLPSAQAATNVTSQVNVTQNGFGVNRTTGYWAAMLTVANKSGTSIPGPIQVVLTNLSTNATMVNNTGVFLGNPFITVTTGALPPGGAAVVTILFTNPTGGLINHIPITYSGSFALISTVAPNDAQQGTQGATVNITGQNTHFAQGTTVASFGAGITVATLTVNSLTTSTAVLNISPSAVTGARDVTLTTGAEVATLINGFTVQAGSPMLVSVSPNTGKQGVQNLSITISGMYTHFVQGVSQVRFGAGVSTGLVTVASSTSLNVPISIDAAATVGSRAVSVTTGVEAVSLSMGFNVLPASLAPVVNAGADQSIALGFSEVAFTEYAGPSSPVFESGDSLGDITTGPDGNLWFTEGYAFGAQTSIGRITPSGTTSYFLIPSGSSEGGIATGPDGNVWFTEYRTNKIGKVTPGGSITEYTIPTGGTYPAAITAGPDGNMWFTETFGNSVLTPGAIGRVTPAGTFTEYSVNSQPRAIVAGPDGNLWFVQYFGNQIGRITTGGVVTEFTVPTSGSYPLGIAVGSDGNLWFTEALADKIGRITPAGTFTEFPLPTSGTSVTEIAAGPDGNLWFTEPSINKVGRITTAGVITEFSVPTAASQPAGITAGPDGNVWFTEMHGNNIVKLALGVFDQPGTTTLNGTVSDDGVPAGSNLSSTWSLGSGPAAVSFGTPTASFLNVASQVDPVASSVTFPATGEYHVNLSASDTVLTSSSSTKVTVSQPAAPVIVSVSPGSGVQGQGNLSVSISGQFTHFVQGSTTAYFGPGITVATLTVTSATSAQATLTIDPAAVVGTRRVALISGSEVATANAAYTVTAAP